MTDSSGAPRCSYCAEFRTSCDLPVRKFAQDSRVKAGLAVVGLNKLMFFRMLCFPVVILSLFLERVFGNWKSVAVAPGGGALRKTKKQMIPREETL